MRKNIFEISEIEKKQILELHINATKNQYIIKENTNQEISKKVAKLFLKSGIPIEDTNEAWYEDGCWTVLIVDGAGYNNIWVNICDNGYFALKGRHYENETFSGNWRIDSNGQANLKLDSGFSWTTSIDKSNQMIHDGSVRGPIVCWLLKQEKFYTDWKSVQEWSWMLDDLLEISESNCSSLTGKIKNTMSDYKEKNSGFWQALGDLIPGF